MKRSPEKTFSIILTVMMIGALGFTGTWTFKARVDPPARLSTVPDIALSSTPSPTPTTANNTATLVPFDLTPSGVNPNIEVFIQAPAGPLQKPYVILSASQIGAELSNVQITGFVNSTDFVCAGTPCTIILGAGSSKIVFKAVTVSGETSREVLASVRVDTTTKGYVVVIESVSQYYAGFADACLRIWGIKDDTDPAWAEFPQFPYQLNTQITLHGLVTNLIMHGIVDVQDCPAGGLSMDMSWPTGCGLERTRNTMITWQNQFDDNIWQAGKEIGIPPKILKTLMEVESQFWPGNQRFYVDEFGLGQINQLGVDSLLRSDNDLYQRACTTVLNNCFLPYLSQPPEQQRMIRGALMNMIDATCPTCTNGVDIAKAKQSIPLVAQVLKANCQQTKNIMDANGSEPAYEDYWKFTLLSYHSGMSCLNNTVKAVKQAGEPMDWDHAAPRVDCLFDARKYVDGFWSSLTAFDSYRYAPGELVDIKYQPVMMATHTPQPTATPLLSYAYVVVKAFMDINDNGIAEESELLNGITVQVKLEDGRILSATTMQGLASFDMSSYPPNTVTTVSLPGLYRSYTFTLPELGIVPVVFIFQGPDLPKQLP